VSPPHIPDVIEVDVSGLKVGESVRVRDVQLPNVTVHNDGELPIASVTAPTVAALPDTEPTTDADVQPELIGRAGEGVDDVPTTEQGG
jgi:large subunit ribosomal protein L25